MLNKSSLTPWLVWITPMTFCAFQFVLRLFPGNIQTELMNEFNVGAAAFGTFSAAYYMGYAGLQIPMAIFMEKYGPRWVVSMSALTCAIGCFILLSTQNWQLAIISRFLIGSGSVAGFLGTTKVIIDWFPEAHHAKMIGFSMSIALMGALYGGKPINLLIDKFNWKPVLLGLGIIAALISVLAFVLIKNPVKNKKSSDELTYADWSSQVLSLLQNKKFMLLAIANFLMVGCLEGFADVWGINYIALSQGIAKSEASLVTSCIFFGMLIGAPLLSFLADVKKAHLQITGMAGIIMSACLCLLLSHPELFSLVSLKLLMIVIGIFSGYQALVFVIGERAVPKNLSNTAIATLNCINMFGGAFFHATIGFVMDLVSSEAINSSNNHIYNLKAYTLGLSVIPLMSMIGGLLIIVLHLLNHTQKNSDTSK